MTTAARLTAFLSIAAALAGGPRTVSALDGPWMTEEAMRAARNSGVSQMTLTVSTENWSAFELYRRDGFVEVARRRALPYQESGDDGAWVLLSKPCSN